MGQQPSTLNMDPLPPAPFPITLVGRQFALDRNVTLHVPMGWPEFDIVDLEGTVFFRVAERMLAATGKLVLIDVEGNDLANARHMLLSVPPEYTTCAGDHFAKRLMLSEAKTRDGNRVITHTFEDAVSGEKLEVKSFFGPYDNSGDIVLTSGDSSKLARIQKPSFRNSGYYVAVAPGVDMTLACIISIIVFKECVRQSRRYDNV